MNQKLKIRLLINNHQALNKAQSNSINNNQNNENLFTMLKKNYVLFWKLKE